MKKLITFVHSMCHIRVDCAVSSWKRLW